jgi:hypothetical protein
LKKSTTNYLIEKMRSQIDDLKQQAREDDVTLVSTSRDMVALIDSKFASLVRNFRWYAVLSQEHIYAVADINGKRITLQRYIKALSLDETDFEKVKHISFRNKISFDCRVDNLEDRLGRQAVMRNRRPKRNTSSKYKGVIKKTKPDGSLSWRGQIKADLGNIHLGVFEEENFAAKVYDAAAFVLFSGAAHFNFPEDCPNPEALDVALLKIERFKNANKNKP